MILPAILYTLHAKIFLGFAAIFGVLFAIGEASSDRTLIVIAIVGSVTTLVVAMLSAIVSIFNSRKLAKVENLPREVQELKISLDGRLQELMDSKEKAAHSAGAEQERTEERGRQGDAAIGAQAAVPIPVIVEETDRNPLHVKQIK